MSVLGNLKPERVFYFFEEISKIPRGSGNTKQISEYLKKFGEDRGFNTVKDGIGNVIITKEASKGRENDDAVIIQGHMDMVCEKIKESNHDFLVDGLELFVDGDFVKAKGTTLGADDGIAVAMALAILEDDSISIPRLYVVITVDEETGMDGAEYIDLSNIDAKYLLNLDCEDDGIAFAGCAGGARIDTVFKVNRKYVFGDKYDITIDGLRGGHSGAEIDKERANANILMARFLKQINDKFGFEAIGLISVFGGTKDNVITKDSKASIVVKHNCSEIDYEILKDEVLEFNKVIKNEYAVSDSDISIRIDKISDTADYLCIGDNEFDDLLFFMNAVPYGPVNYSADFKGIVETSLNMGVVNTKDDEINVGISVRSLVGSRKKNLIEKIRIIAKRSNASTSIRGNYPEWEYKRGSKLQNIITEEYYNLYGKEMKIDIIHAGLECGYFIEKKPDLDILSFGPMIYDIHTPDERMSISSTEENYKLVLRLLERL